MSQTNAFMRKMNAGSGGKKSVTSLHNTITGSGNKTFFGKPKGNFGEENYYNGGEMIIH